MSPGSRSDFSCREESERLLTESLHEKLTNKFTWLACLLVIVQGSTCAYDMA
jgi:hypothetical protein